MGPGLLLLFIVGDILGAGVYAVTGTMAGTVGGIVWGPFMLIPLLLQVGLGLGPMHAGLMMVPVAAAGMVSKQLAVRLVERFGYRRVLMVNTVLVGLAMASFILMTPGQHLAWRLLQLAFFGAVNSLQFTVMNTVTLRDLDREFASSGNSLLSMVMMLAAGLGAEVLIETDGEQEEEAMQALLALIADKFGEGA